jgi:hypothetical protein
MCRFINNELNLSHIEVYGFDYDASIYTSINSITLTMSFYSVVYISQLYRKSFIHHLQFASRYHCGYYEISQGNQRYQVITYISIHDSDCVVMIDFRYDPNFAIRGLHYGI